MFASTLFPCSGEPDGWGVPSRSLQEAKDSQRSSISMRRQDSAHEGPCSPLPWNLHTARKLEKTCRDSASSFDRCFAAPPAACAHAAEENVSDLYEKLS